MRAAATVFVVAVLASFASSAEGAGGGTPTIRVAGLAPFTVRGTGFLPVERVRLKFVAGKTKVGRAVIASRAGTFTVSFGTMPQRTLCGTTFVVTALGARGDRAVYRDRLECTTAASALPSPG